MTPVDDSVVKIVDNDVLISRCGRGYSPAAIALDTKNEIIALGGEQKTSVCIVHKGTAHISQYLGELSNIESCNEYIQVTKRLANILKTEPKIVAHDLHPDYFTTQLASKLDKEKIAIQHHHAHMAGCIAEHGLTNNVIGIIFDGTGMGTDGNVWGGELFIGTRAKYQRVGHLKYCTLQGGNLAIKEPWRCAVSYLYSLNIDSLSYFPEIDKQKIDTIKKALQYKINCFESSSMGRLFDCIAALVLHRTHITYDAQAAIELESILDATVTDKYDFSIKESAIDGTLIISYKQIIEGVLTDINEGKATSYISTKFHNTIYKATIVCVIKLRKIYNINDVVLSGGVFENTYLLTITIEELKNQGFNVYYNKQVPLNDGGLSFGQAAVAASILEEEENVPGSTCNDNISK